MKKCTVGVILYVAVSMLACQDSRDELKIQPDYSYFKNIGEEIPFETGMRWIEFYKANHPNAAGRTNLVSQYNISDERLEQLLGSVTNPVGIAFHYGRDAWGIKHIIAIPIDGSLSLFNSIPGRIYVDAKTDNVITQSTAYTWAMNYRDVNPGEIWFHFFGTAVFDEIQAVSFFSSLDIEQALNDLELTEEMLLIVWNTEGLLGLGRTADDDCRMFDASSPCPPCGIQD